MRLMGGQDCTQTGERSVQLPDSCSTVAIQPSTSFDKLLWPKHSNEPTSEPKSIPISIILSSFFTPSHYCTLPITVALQILLASVSVTLLAPTELFSPL